MSAEKAIERPKFDDDPKTLIQTEMRGNVLLAVIDMPVRSMNVFSWGLMDALEMLIEQIRSDDAIKAAVITSGKSSFLAGADLDMIDGFAEMPNHASREEVHHTTGRLGRLFVELEALPKPSVAAVNGLALGGGLELSMACCYRVVLDDPKTQLSLPEIKLGLLPGGGGTQRMPRIIGIEKAAELLLNGRSLSAREALEVGLVDEVVGAERLIDRAIEVASELASKGQWRKLPQHLDPGPFDLSAPDAVRQIIRHCGYSDDTANKYPAYDAITRVMVEGADMPIAEGDHNEMAGFVDLMFDKKKTAASMLRSLFLNRQLADKQTAGLTSGQFELRCDDNAALRAALLKSSTKAGGKSCQIVGAGQQAGSDRAALVLLTKSGDELEVGRVGVFYCRSDVHGSVLEIVSNDGDEEVVAAALSLAKTLRATPYRHSANYSLLAAIEEAGLQAASNGLDEEAVLAAQSAVAKAAAAQGVVGDVRFADVACVVGGIVPAYTGGLYTYMRCRE